MRAGAKGIAFRAISQIVVAQVANEADRTAAGSADERTAPRRARANRWGVTCRKLEVRLFRAMRLNGRE
jgi:hypothetical protein